MSNYLKMEMIELLCLFNFINNYKKKFKMNFINGLSVKPMYL